MILRIIKGRNVSGLLSVFKTIIFVRHMKNVRLFYLVEYIGSTQFQQVVHRLNKAFWVCPICFVPAQQFFLKSIFFSMVKNRKLFFAG